MTSAPDDLEDRITSSLRRTADQAPSLDTLRDRVLAGPVDADPSTPRWRAVATIGLAAAAVAGVIVVSVTLFGGDSGPAPSEHPVVMPANPSTRPDFALCDSLASQVADEAELVRAVTVGPADLEGWLSVPIGTFEHLDPAAPTTVCVYRTSPQPPPGPPRAESDGVEVLAQSADRWDVRSIGPVADLYQGLQPLAEAAEQAFWRRSERHTDGVSGPRAQPGEPCPDAKPATLPRTEADTVSIRVPDTTVANPDNLAGVFTCGSDLPALHYPGVDVYFEEGSDMPSDHWQGFVDQWDDSFVVTVDGIATLVSHPVNGTLGEVIYVRDGMLMRVLGDGSVPADRLLEVVTSSEPLGDRQLP